MLFEKHASDADQRILPIPFGGKVGAQRDLKSAALSRPERLARRIDQNLGVPQNHLIEWIVKLKVHIQSSQRAVPAVGNRSCNVGELLIQQVRRLRHSTGLKMYLRCIGLLGGGERELLAGAGPVRSRCAAQQHQPRGQNKHDYHSYGERRGESVLLFAVVVLSGLCHFLIFLSGQMIVGVPMLLAA